MYFVPNGERVLQLGEQASKTYDRLLITKYTTKSTCINKINNVCTQISAIKYNTILEFWDKVCFFLINFFFTAFLAAIFSH